MPQPLGDIHDAQHSDAAGHTAPQGAVPAVSGADSVSVVEHAAVPRDLHPGHEIDAPVSLREQTLYASKAPAWHSGVDTVMRPMSAARDSSVLMLVTICFVLLALNHRSCGRLLHNFIDKVRKPRRRSNTLDDNTANESRIQLLMLGQTCILEAILLFVAIGASVPDVPAIRYVGLLTALTVGYVILQNFAYLTIAYVFAPRGYVAPFVGTFNATQAVLGMGLLIPTLATLFYPSVAAAMLMVAALMYLTARILFIKAGFRIFYHNFASLLYFFLYLCTLEIIPLLAMYRTAVSLCHIL